MLKVCSVPGDPCRPQISGREPRNVFLKSGELQDHFRLIHGMRDEADAEDVVQQIFLDVYRSIQQFDRDKGSFKIWLFMFAYHRTFNSRRSKLREDCLTRIR